MTLKRRVRRWLGVPDNIVVYNLAPEDQHKLDEVLGQYVQLQTKCNNLIRQNNQIEMIVVELRQDWYALRQRLRTV